MITTTPDTSADGTEIVLTGCMFTAPSIIPDVRRVVREDDFGHADCRLCFKAITQVYDETGEVPIHDLLGRIKTLGGSPDFMASCAEEGSGSITLWHRYAARVALSGNVRAAMALSQEAVHSLSKCVLERPDGADAATEYLGAMFERLGRIVRPRNVQPAAQLATASDRLIEHIGMGESGMVATGVDILDGIAGGIPRRGVLSIYGYPGASKTTLALTIALQAAGGCEMEAPVPVRIYSVEQGPERVAATLLSQRAKAPVHSYLNRAVMPDQTTWDAIVKTAREFGKLDFAIWEESLDPTMILAELVALKAPRGVLIVDYIQDVPPWGPWTETTPRIGEAMRIFARIAKELGWLVIVVSQCDKAAAKSGMRPRASDALGSSSIEQRSDMILSVWRPHKDEQAPLEQVGEYGEEKDVVRRFRARFFRVQIGVIKNKYGPTGSIDGMFEPSSMTFRPATPEEQSCWSNP